MFVILYKSVILLYSVYFTESLSIKIDCNNKGFICDTNTTFYQCNDLGLGFTVADGPPLRCPEGLYCNNGSEVECGELIEEEVVTSSATISTGAKANFKGSLSLKIDCNNKGFVCENNTSFYLCTDLGLGSTFAEGPPLRCPEGLYCNNGSEVECGEIIEDKVATSNATTTIGAKASLSIKIDCYNKGFICETNTTFYLCTDQGLNSTIAEGPPLRCPEGLYCNNASEVECGELIEEEAATTRATTTTKVPLSKPSQVIDCNNKGFICFSNTSFYQCVDGSSGTTVAEGPPLPCPEGFYCVDTCDVQCGEPIPGDVPATTKAPTENEDGSLMWFSNIDELGLDY